jgi:hypothetical protein
MASEPWPDGWACRGGPLDGVPLPSSHPYPGELAALLSDEKPVLFISRTPYNAELLKALERRVGLSLREPRVPKGVPPRTDYLLMGRRPADLAEAEAAWNESTLSVRWGELLGYPRCCVTAYVETVERRGDRDVVRAADARTRAKGPRDWRLNNLFNHFSRVVSANSGEHERFKELCAAARFPADRVQAAFWHPCAYDCAGSLALAGKIERFLAAHVPGFLERVRPLLARRWAYRGDFSFAALAGASGRTIDPSVPTGLSAEDASGALVLDFL